MTSISLLLPFQSVTQRGHTDTAALPEQQRQRGLALYMGGILAALVLGKPHELWAHSDAYSSWDSAQVLEVLEDLPAGNGPAWSMAGERLDRAANTPCEGRHQCLGGEGWGKLGPAPLALQQHSSFIASQQWMLPGTSPAVFWSFVLQQIKKNIPFAVKPLAFWSERRCSMKGSTW